MDYEKIYEYRFKDIEQNSKIKVWKEIAHFLYEKMNCPKSILDPAAGMCEFLNQVPSGEKWGVDMNSFIFKNCSSEIKGVVGDIFEVELPQNYFEGVFISNFLEHLSTNEDVFKLFTKLKTHLKKDGVVCIMGPNFKHCFKEYFDCADHLLPLTHISVEEMLFSAGYKILETHSKFLPFSFRGILPPSSFLTKMYLNMPLFWPILGKQFLILATPIKK